jgi:hypothetical protein
MSIPFGQDSIKFFSFVGYFASYHKTARNHQQKTNILIKKKNHTLKEGFLVRVTKKEEKKENYVSLI